MHSTEALPLPRHPSAEHFHKTAKDLLAAARTGDDATVQAWAATWLERLAAAAEVRVSERDLRSAAGRVVSYWSGGTPFRDMPPARKTLAGAQFFLARAHGFPSWAALMRHIGDLGRRDSSVARFEAAVDAIAGGDIETLQRLLREHPDLVRARSSRNHGATLLHYVSANGVEGYRQRTPPNIVAITSLLLDAGADINAIAHCYGEDDVIGLTATSAHPANAGVMIPMLELLVARGAAVDRFGSIVRACIANGQPEAAAWLADHGARVSLPDAFGIGRLDLVREHLAPDGTLMKGATDAQLEQGFNNASWYRQIDAIRYLLDAGFDVNRRFADGSTALHHAAYDGHPETVELLLARGARTDVRESEHGGTPRDWAEYASQRRSGVPKGTDYARVMELLKARG